MSDSRIQKYKNPIISGYNPDPSICRVGDDFYLVNSTFEFYPGVPVYHSKNLVNWELINYCLRDKEQLYLDGVRPSGGIYAPMLCYHNGEFFMTTTNVSHKGHLIVHTSDIYGEWSKPVWIDQGGIDPTLLFDGEDVYFASTSRDEDDRDGIFMCKINPYTGEKLSESVCISHGCGGICPEGSHIYKLNGKYYLLLAEGGTEYGHMVTMQRADSPFGPYEACPHNPILSHRDNPDGSISCTGHADLEVDQNGNWWLVCLGIRPSCTPQRGLKLHHLGRETFLSPVIWNEEGWPVVGNNGRIDLEMEGPLPGNQVQPICRNFTDNFSEEKFSLHYNWVRTPHMENYVRDTAAGQLILKGTSVTLNDMDTPTWVGIKQKEFDVEADVVVSLKENFSDACPVSQDSNVKGLNKRVGLGTFYNQFYHYEIYLTREDGQYKVCLSRHIHDMFARTAEKVVSSGENIHFRIIGNPLEYDFWYSEDGKYYEKLGSGSTAGLATEGTMYMSFTGTYIGMFSENAEGHFRNFSVKINKN